MEARELRIGNLVKEDVLGIVEVKGFDDKLVWVSAKSVSQNM